MTRGFTCYGEWQQVAENADSPLEFSMFINHGTHIFDGASWRMSGSAPDASKPDVQGAGRGGNRSIFRTPDASLQRRGLRFRFPPLVPRSPENRATSREHSPRIPPARLSIR